jgi:hypothetical protein
VSFEVRCTNFDTAREDYRTEWFFSDGPDGLMQVFGFCIVPCDHMFGVLQKGLEGQGFDQGSVR